MIIDDVALGIGARLVDCCCAKYVDVWVDRRLRIIDRQVFGSNQLLSWHAFLI
jgi:hypothetical protein